MKHHARSTCLVAGALLTVLVAAQSTAAAGPLVENGRFLDPTAPADYYTQIQAGAVGPAGWGVTSGSVDVYSEELTHLTDAQSVNLNGNGPGTLRQTVTTTPGTAYVLSWRHAPDTWTGDPRPPDDPDDPEWPGSCADKPLTDQRYAVSVTGTREEVHTPTGTVEDPGWETMSRAFTAGEHDTTITFSSEASTENLAHCGPQITHVQLVPAGSE